MEGKDDWSISPQIAFSSLATAVIKIPGLQSALVLTKLLVSTSLSETFYNLPPHITSINEIEHDTYYSQDLLKFGLKVVRTEQGKFYVLVV